MWKKEHCVPAISNIVVMSHMWLMSTWNVASAILVNLNLNSHMWPTATILYDTVPGLNNKKEQFKGQE